MLSIVSGRKGKAAVIRRCSLFKARKFCPRHQPCIGQLFCEGGHTILIGKAFQIGKHVKYPFVLHVHCPPAGLMKG